MTSLRPWWFGRIGEPVQVDSEALGLLTTVGLVPGQPRPGAARRGEVAVRRDGSEESTGPAAPGHRLHGRADLPSRLPAAAPASVQVTRCRGCF